MSPMRQCTTIENVLDLFSFLISIVDTISPRADCFRSRTDRISLWKVQKRTQPNGLTPAAHSQHVSLHDTCLLYTSDAADE